MNKFLLLIITTLILFFSADFAESVPADNGKIVSVGISDQKFSNYYYNQIPLTATDKFKLSDKSNGEVIGDFGAGEIVNISIKNNLFIVMQGDTEIATQIKGPIVLESNNGYVSVANLKRVGKPAYYRGTIEVTKAPTKDNQFNVINYLDVESYLQGVVPNEMPVKFGLEALKAQAVLARNYVLKPRVKNYHNFDVCDSVACQVYFGANTEKELANQAIEETKNIVALYDHELILALYSSTSGGYTESYENAFSTDSASGVKNFPGEPSPYMKGVPDNKKTPILANESAARKFYTSRPDTFDNESPYFRWVKEWDLLELENVLKRTLKTQSSTGFVKPKLENSDDFGSLKDLNVVKRGVSGKAMSIDIVTDKGIFNIQKELPIRRAFQKDGKALPSANVIFDVEDGKVIVHGGGYGHGVGMSQWGAGAMNQKGYSYVDIIQHYFTNVAIATNPVILSTQDEQDTSIQTFYTQNKKATLVVENKFQFTKMTMVLNGQEFSLELAPKLFKPEKFDLSPYIVNGENKITFILPYSEQHKKPVKLYVELYEAKE